MADFSIIINHPDSEEIISKLMSGSSPKEIYQWLKLKYPNQEQSHLRVSQKLLKELANSPLTDLYQQFKKDYSSLKQTGNISSSLANNKAYKERIAEVANKEIDIINLIQNLVTAAYQRMEQVFDTIQENPRSFKGDNYLLRYLAEITSAAEKLEKIRLGGDNQLIQHNITVEAVEAQAAILQDAVRDILAEIDPDTAMLFIEKLNTKLAKLQPPKDLSQDERLNKAKMLEAKIVSYE